MFRGCLSLIVGLLLGAGIMLALWPRPPAGVTAPATSDMRLVLSDRYLAQTVAQRVSIIAAATVSNVRVTSNPPSSLTVSVQLSLGPLSAPASLQLAPLVQNGRVRTDLVASQVAGVPIPPQLGGFVTDAINSRADALLNENVRVTGIQVLPSGLEIWADNR